jgi:hypothetical protein
MKTKLTILFFLLVSVVNSQKLVCLNHAGVSFFYSGNTPVNDAVTAAVSGDTIYIPGGGFSIGNLNIDKSLVIYGVGHDPDSTLATGRTELSGSIYLLQGASDSHLEGFYLSGNIYFGTNASDQFVENIKISRINLGALYISYSGSAVTTSNNIIITENYLRSELYGGYAVGLVVSKNFLTQGMRYLSNSLFTNNIFFGGYCGGGPISNADNCLFQNNYFYVGFGPCCCQYLVSGNSNHFQNNATNLNWSFPDGTNTGSGNWFNVPASTLFVNCPANTIDYTYDYHLQTPASYLGTDGFQIGIYGTNDPVKEGWVPENPHVVIKTISPQTDSNGDLYINIKVGAQND